MSTTHPAFSPASGLSFLVEDQIAILSLDQPGRAVNVLSRPVLDEMKLLLDWLDAERPPFRALLIRSTKRGCFIAGMDIEEFTRMETPADGERLSREGHDLLGRLGTLPFPTVAVIDGAALGGGLELALACTARIASTARQTKLGLPEVQLGLLPGGGGTQRLPRLVGIQEALTLMLTGKQLDAKRAQKMGLVDEAAPSAILMDVAKRYVQALERGERTLPMLRDHGSPKTLENIPGVQFLIFKQARKGVLAQTRGKYPAPLRILDVVQRGISLPLSRALELEAHAFGLLTATPEAQSLVHLFFTSTAAKNGESLAPAETRPVASLCVVGAGFMGAGISVVSAEAGLQVRMKDTSHEGVARGYGLSFKSILARAKKKKMRPYEITAIQDRVTGSLTYDGLKNSAMVVEAVFEDLSLKQQIVRDLEAHGGEHLIIASNTSTLPIGRLAEAAKRPEQVIGLHFFSPVEKMPLVEIITHEKTAPWVVATCHAYAKKIGKTPIVVSDSPGFYVNRILLPYMSEALLLLEEGAAIDAVDGALQGFGYAVGPIKLYDEVGLDVASKAGKVMTEAFGDRIQSSPLLDRMMDDGRLGRKNARGFYLYQEGKKGVDTSVYSVLGLAPRPSAMSKDAIAERLVYLMLGEAARCLEEGVLRSAGDGDVGAVFGLGFPPFLGGPFWYMDRLGLPQVVDTLRRLSSMHGPRYAPCILLERLAKENAKFSSLDRQG